MRQFAILLKRELLSITREKTIIFAILIQFCIASCSSVILIGIMAFYNPASIAENTRVKINVGVVGEEVRPAAGYLMAEGVGVKLFADAGRAESAFRAGRMDALISGERSQSGVVNMKLTLPKMDIKKTVVLMLLDEPLKQYENHLREANGVQLYYSNTEGKPNTTYEFLYSIIIPVLMLFPALIAGSIVIDSVSEELENKTFDTLLSAPISLVQVFSAKIAAALLSALVQLLMWTGLLRLNGITIQNPASVIMFAVVIAFVIAVVTAVIAVYFRDRERAQFTYSITLVVAMLASYFLNPSPLNLITGLAAGETSTTIIDVALYAIPLLIIGMMVFKMSCKLVLARR